MNTKFRICFGLALLSICLVLSSATPLRAQGTAVKKIDLNTATAAELESLKGVGPALAQKIIAARPFKNVEDLKNVSGVGQATFDGLKNLVTVTTSKPAQTAEAKIKTKVNSEPASKEAGVTAAVELVNVNTADKAGLENLPGVGATLAEAIIAARPFKSVEDLKNVKGIGEAKFAQLQKLVTIATPASVKTAAVKTKVSTQAAGTAATQTAAAGLVDLNTADKAGLENLPGVGSVLAEAIIAARPFKSVEDLKNVKGIGEAKFSQLQKLVIAGQEDEGNVQPKLKPGDRINLNTASLEQLDALLGIGPVKAQAIIAGRPYSKIEDIMKVKGIKEKTFAKIKDYLVVK